jgi:hypothetical protein
VLVAQRFDDALVQALERGARVLLLPDGQRNSLPLHAHWFLRGGPYVAGHHLTKTAPRDFLVELQHFDLGSDVVPNLGYLENVDPVLLLWDTHAEPEVKTHGLVFAARAAQGRLLVSALRHRGPWNAAGRWLLEALLKELADGPPPKNALTPRQWDALKQKLHEREIALTDRKWLFRPDAENKGREQDWHLPALQTTQDWKEIRIGRSWESEGYPNLDGWAWYRLEVDIPSDWQRQHTYVCFQGVDDAYELYVNGRLAGQGGDVPARRSAFFDRNSHDVTQLIKAGQKCLIAVRVYDFQGAGGLFRPVVLRTTPLATEAEILK